MKKLAVFLLALAALAVCAPAAPDPAAAEDGGKTTDAGKPAAAEKPEAAFTAKKTAAAKADKTEPEPAVTPAKQPGMFTRIFGRRPMTISKPEKNDAEPKPSPPPRGKAKASPEPKPSPSPKPDSKPTPEPKVTASPSPKPSPPPKPTPKPRKPKATPDPKKEDAPDTEPLKTTPPKADEGAKEPAKLDPSLTPVVEEKEAPKPEASPVEADSRERERFNAARAKALQDPSVRALKEKAESAPSDDELRKASKEFYKALYKKMRALDGSLKDRIDRMESAMMRRVDSGASDAQ